MIKLGRLYDLITETHFQRTLMCLENEATAKLDFEEAQLERTRQARIKEINDREDAMKAPRSRELKDKLDTSINNRIYNVRNRMISLEANVRKIFEKYRPINVQVAESLDSMKNYEEFMDDLRNLKTRLDEDEICFGNLSLNIAFLPGTSPLDFSKQFGRLCAPPTDVHYQTYETNRSTEDPQYMWIPTEGFLAEESMSASVVQHQEQETGKRRTEHPRSQSYPPLHQHSLQKTSNTKQEIIINKCAESPEAENTQL